MGSSENKARQSLDLTAQDAQERLTSSDLLKGRQQIEIEHAGEVYRLRLTKSGKLILTK